MIIQATEKPVTIDDIEDEMLTMEQADCPVIHRFSPGLYIRELHMKAGIFAVGHYQKTEHFNLFLKGRVLSKDASGENIELTAPMTFTAPPGRKFGYILEDVVWLNVYPTDETDVETLEDMFFTKSKSWKESKKLLDMVDRSNDNEDYEKLLIEYGFTEETTRKQSEDMEDQVPMPYGDYKFLISKSKIEGRGVFASANIREGEVVGQAKIMGKRTPIGRYTNHSSHPNAKMVGNNGDIYMVATQNIMGCRGGFPGEEITTDYRKNLKLIGVNKCLE